MTKNPPQNQNQKEYKSPPIGHEISCVMKGVNSEFLKDNLMFEKLLKKILKQERFKVLKFVSHHFSPKGYTAMALLSESHLAVHTYPEHNSVYFNMYSCRGNEDAKQTFEKVKNSLNPLKILFYKDNQVPI